MRRFEQSSPRIPDPAAFTVAARTEADLWTVWWAIAVGLTSSTAVTRSVIFRAHRAPVATVGTFLHRRPHRGCNNVPTVASGILTSGSCSTRGPKLHGRHRDVPLRFRSNALVAQLDRAADF